MYGDMSIVQAGTGPEVRIGLFGTAGHSTWRQRFIDAYVATGTLYYTPQVAVGTWDPSMADVEAENLAGNRVLVFALTGETYGTATMAEIGIAATSVKGTDRHLLVYVELNIAFDKVVDPEVVGDDENVRALLTQIVRNHENARALLIAHLGKLNLPNVTLCTSLDAMLQESLRLARELENQLV